MGAQLCSTFTQKKHYIMIESLENRNLLAGSDESKGSSLAWWGCGLGGAILGMLGSAGAQFVSSHHVNSPRDATFIGLLTGGTIAHLGIWGCDIACGVDRMGSAKVTEQAS